MVVDKYNRRFVPYKATHPGELLMEELRERGIKQKDFAKAIDVQPTHLCEFIKGKRDLNEELALKLEAELGIPYIAWMNMQSSYWLDVKAIAEREENKRKTREYHSAAPSGLTLAT